MSWRLTFTDRQVMLFTGMVLGGVLGASAPVGGQEPVGQEPATESAPEAVAETATAEATPPAPEETAEAAEETGTAVAEPAEAEAPTETETADESDTAAEAEAPVEEGPAVSEPPGPSFATKAEAFAVQLQAWKDLLKELRDVRTQFKLAEQGELAGLQEAWQTKLQKGHGMLPGLRAAAIEAYQEQPNVDRELSRFLIKLLADDIRADDYEAGLEIAHPLLDGESNEDDVANLVGIVAFANNDFELAKAQLEMANESGALTDQGRGFLSVVDEYQQLWAEEKKLRDAEAEADDLPRVKFTTSEGDVVIELLENEAPGAVGNFINLVEKGFYNDLTFHRVIPGFMAQGGDPAGDGSGGPGYNIYCECVNKDHRKHFRGSLSMAHAGRDTGGSQFFLTFVPTPHLNGRHTVFGRVIEGMDVLSRLRRGEPVEDPSRITRAEVLRKRDHEYRPNKVK